MTVTAVRKDQVAHVMTLDAEFDASPERVWQLWADPRQLERWWGPPMYPATFTELDLAPGGHAAYYMTGPTGDQPRGWWEILETAPPHDLVVLNGLADEQGNPNPAFPQMVYRINIAEVGGGRTKMTIRTEFPSIEAMEQMLAMGMEEGLIGAVGQIDAILTEKVPA